MALRERWLPRTQQPQEACGVDWRNPLAHGLRAAFVLNNSLRDVVSGQNATNTGGVFAASPIGVGFAPITAGIVVPWDTGASSSAHTLTLVEYRVSAPSSYWFIADNRASGSGYIYGSSAAWYTPYGSAALTTPGTKTTSISATHQAQNGSVASVTNDTGFAFNANVRLLCRYTDVDPYSSTIVAAIYIHDRNLSVDEMLALHANPWQVFEPRRIWVPVSAGGGGATESRTVSVSGVGDAAWQATAINAQTIASAGVGAASWQGVAITARQLASDGVAAASWQGGAVVGQTIASAGVAAVAFDGVALAPASLSAAGSAAASWQATSIAAATVASAGQASAAWQSVWVHQQAFSSAGVAAASWVGTDASGGTTIEPRTIASAGVGSATWQASVVAAADLVSDGIGAAAWQAAARVVAAFTSAGSSAFAPESARIDVRTLTAAGVGAAAFDGQDAGTVEARTFSSGGAASVSFAVEGEPERAHGFEIGPATTKPKRRGLVVVDETEEKPARQKITKRDIDRRVFERAREEARAVIAKAAEQHATTQHVKAERFAQVRTALKPLAKAIGDWNWIAVYQRMYQQALDEQIRQELAREDAIAAEAQAAEEADERELMNLIMEWM